MDNVPPGAEFDTNAPWLEPNNKIKVKVCVSVIYSKTVEVEIDKDYCNEDLEDAVRRNYYLLGDIYNHPSISLLPTNVIEDLSGWNEDEFVVIKEE